MPTYLITQATGKQSQWTITHLLEAGANIHAVVRDPAKIPDVLKHPKITVFKGESNDLEAVYQAAQGCVAVFLNTFPIPGLEAEQARVIVEASKKAGIETIVASTTFFTNNKAMWDDDATKECNLHGYFSSKFEVEDIVRNAGFKAYTILRPAFIHFDYLIPNVIPNIPELPKSGTLEHAFNDGARMPHTDANDIGKYAAAALQDPAKFGGQEIDLGNELLTPYEARDILARVSGKNVRVKKRTPAQIEDAKTTVQGQKFQLWANVKDFSFMEASAKAAQAKFGIPFTSLESALQRDKVKLLDCLPNSI